MKLTEKLCNSKANGLQTELKHAFISGFIINKNK